LYVHKEIMFINLKPEIMKKIVILLFALFFMGTAFAQDKKLYLSLGPGFGMGISRSYDINVYGTGDKVTPVSLGKGININLRAGYCVSSFLAIELGIVYRLGLGTKLDIEGNYYPEKATYNMGTAKYKSNMLQLVPAIVISPFAEENKLRPYARVGLIVGLMPSIIETTDFKDYSGSNNEKATFKYSGGIAAGGSAAIGCDYDLSDMLAIYAEIYFNAISYAPTKGKYIKDELNGTDVLPDMTTQQKEFEFVKDVSNYEPSSGSPTQVLKNSYPLNNAGLNIGIKIKL
jgi:hypothetical protein